MLKIQIKNIILSSAILLLPFQVFAHDMWIHSPDFTPKYSKKFGSTVTIYGGWGHLYPIDDIFKVDSTFKIIDPNNKIKVLETKKLLAEKVVLKKEGNYIISGHLEPYFWTSYFDKKGNKTGKREPKTGINNVIESKQFNRFTKSIISTGKIEDENYSRTIGDTLEIVPLQNPNKILGNGQYLTVKVLFNGKPASYQKILGTYAGFSNQGDYSIATKTDKEGIAKIKLNHSGYWLLKTEKTLEVKDKNLIKKCDKIFYSASLTFEVQ